VVEIILTKKKNARQTLPRHDDPATPCRRRREPAGSTRPPVQIKIFGEDGHTRPAASGCLLQCKMLLVSATREQEAGVVLSSRCRSARTKVAGKSFGHLLSTNKCVQSRHQARARTDVCQAVREGGNRTFGSGL
jgi:hypothetical protein